MSSCTFCKQNEIKCICGAVDSFFEDCRDLPREQEAVESSITSKVALGSIISACLLLVACGKSPSGSQGNVGDPAQPCTVRPVLGGVDIICPDGSMQEILNGAVGPVGATGEAGKDGESPTTVQFCPGTTTYPSTFPEYGLCFSGKLFAVYWDKDNLNAWLSEVPPGRYKSTSTGLECSFTVSANCQIHN